MRSMSLPKFALLLSAALCVVSSVHAASQTSGWFDSCLFQRQIDGRCNNFFERELGSINKYLKRGAEGAFYVDGVREPYIFPNPRTVSNDLFRADDTILDPHGHNAAWVFFGQFVTHDLMGVHRVGDLNATDLNDDNLRIIVPLEQPNDAFNITIPRIPRPFLRVLKSRGDIVNGRFEVASDSTAWLDLDTVYGKEEHVTELLRTHQNGLMHTRTYNNYTRFPNSLSVVPEDWATAEDFGEWLPLVADVDPNRTAIPVSNQLVPTFTRNIIHRFFATGDGRNAENYGLQMFQGLFLLEHNRLAREIKQRRPFWSDESIFQEARKTNIAAYQAIVMYEYLPATLRGEYNRVGNYDGYDRDVDPTVSQLFAFANRFGHTTVPASYYLRDACNERPFGTPRDGPRGGQPVVVEMPADQLAQIGRLENVIHALLFEPARRVDVQFPEGLRSIPSPAFTDVIVQNQVRASENGIPPYHFVRKLWYGGNRANLYNLAGCNVASESSASPDPIACFNYITANATVANALRNLYGKITQINFYTAVVAEDPEDATVGRTSARIIADQFKRVRDADRWWFESDASGFNPREKRQFKRTKLSDVLKRNFPNLNVQDNTFHVPGESHFATCSNK